MKAVKVRFAPSPSGHLHIGGARTALFNYLFAKKHKGTFLFRLEDTDQARSSEESEKAIMDAMHWLGITWDEGVGVGGSSGPYISTQRKDIYNEYLQKLIDERKAYYCFCTPEELEAERKAAEEKGEMYFYSGKCADLDYGEAKRRVKAGEPATIRLRVKKGENIQVHDRVRGLVAFESDGIGDFIIAKSDGIPVYNFAVVVDDMLMGITHVIRGEEHLSNTPRQILVYNALGAEPPEFAHVSLILGADRTKMSKRHGSTWVDQYQEAGYLSEAIVNFLALLGWSPETSDEFFTMEQLIQSFSLDRVSKNPAVFDNNKLKWMNQKYIKEAPTQRIAALALKHLVKAGYLSENPSADEMEWLEKAVGVVQDSLQYVGQIAKALELFYTDDVEPENEEARQTLQAEFIPVLFESFRRKVMEADFACENVIKSIFKEVGKETGIKGKKLFMTIRIATTGMMHGPDINATLMLLGKGKIIERLDKYLNNQ